MPTEYEAKILDIAPGEIATLITAKGGTQTREPTLMRRRVYDIISGDASTWIRLRDTGSETTLCVKKIHDDTIDGTEEVESGVDDFDTTNELLGMMGFRPKSYQENRRTSFTLDGARLEIDTWPLIPPYLEIESESRDHVLQVAAILGYPEEQLTAENTTKIYGRYGIDLNTIADLRL